ncbi:MULTISPECIES: DUF1292 domain-containing protein [unclassified Sporosarcina]|uniref:DUF1292 domain-containing protein n=1 Tax=unclassified Sporosarcina TaxID=2647733 RepID=UPI001A93720E|nr:MULTISPECIES: DUF1292 domain-containing protein [unclassified Sporosarcina]MBO0588205.1 DUF1292 domain-containing protein [Sporosarcina sp. E16_8]MBO0601959.1 DUF1292 domain-containing protein [Sporosarcina sp. E16_3]
MRISIIVVNENDVQLDLLNVEQVIVIDDVQYAIVQNDTQQTFCKIVKEYDQTMRLADIVDDSEFEMVQKVFVSALAPQ